ncbi:MAG: outer membrane beta-barrel protein [Verrucomicrobiia bacterium]
MKTVCRWPVALLAALLPCQSFAQTAQTLPQVETERQFNIEAGLRSEEPRPISRIADTIAPSSPGDDDLGLQQILSRRERYKAFSIFGDISSFYTSNAFLTKRNTRSDAYIVGQVGALWQPQIVGNLFGELSLRQQFFRYDEFEVLDFNAFNTGTGLTYLLSDFFDILVSLRYNYQRLSPRDSFAAFYENHSITPGAQKLFPFSRAHYAYVGWSSQISFTDPNAPQRDEHALYLGYNANLTRHLVAQAYYRFAYFDYAVGGRDDINQTLSAGLSYNFTEWLSLNGSVAGNFNNSNKPAFDYQTATLGGGLSLRYRF